MLCVVICCLYGVVGESWIVCYISKLSRSFLSVCLSNCWWCVCEKVRVRFLIYPPEASVRGLASQQRQIQVGLPDTNQKSNSVDVHPLTCHCFAMRTVAHTSRPNTHSHTNTAFSVSLSSLLTSTARLAAAKGAPSTRRLSHGGSGRTAASAAGSRQTPRPALPATCTSPSARRAGPTASGR